MLELTSLEKLKKIGTKIGDFYTDNKRVFFKNGMIAENDLDFLLERIKLLKRRDFFHEHTFYPSEKDWKIIRKDIPWILLGITNKCNSGCKICFVGNHNFEEIKLNDLKWILSKIGKGKGIIFFFKEPTMHPDLFKMISLIKKSGNYPELFTNGLKLADPEYVKELKRRGITRVNFSFEGFHEKIFEKLVGDENQLYLKLKALKNLETYRINTILSYTIVDGINEDQLRWILNFATYNKFIKGILVGGATPYGRFNVKMKRYLTPSDLIKLLEEVSDGKIRKEYFLEFYRFKQNIASILEKMGIFFPASTLNTLFKIETHSEPKILEYIPLDELRKINEAIEKHKLLTVLKYVLKYGLRRVLNPIKGYYDTFNENVLWILPAVVNTPINYSHIRCEGVNISKVEGGKFIITRFTP